MPVTIKQPVVFPSNVCVHGAVFEYRVCYTTNLEGVALLHPQSHASVVTPFFLEFSNCGLGI